MVLTMFQSAVAGFYNPETGDMYVIEGMDVIGQKPTIVHELIHALEDQHLDFQGASLPLMDNTDRTFAQTCVVEGSAEYAAGFVRRRWARSPPWDVPRSTGAACSGRPCPAGCP